MKTNSLLFSLMILSLSFTVLPARATSPTEETAPVQLPVYVIKAECQSAGEQAINRSLQQLRAAAAKPIAIENTATPLKSQTAGDTSDKKTPTVVVAGL
jgi:hypothetical protein